MLPGSILWPQAPDKRAHVELAPFEHPLDIVQPCAPGNSIAIEEPPCDEQLECSASLRLQETVVQIARDANPRLEGSRVAQPLDKIETVQTCDGQPRHQLAEHEIVDPHPRFVQGEQSPL